MRKHVLLILTFCLLILNIFGQKVKDKKPISKEEKNIATDDFYLNEEITNEDFILKSKLQNSVKTEKKNLISDHEIQVEIPELNPDVKSYDQEIIDQKLKIIEKLKSEIVTKGDNTFVSESDSLALVALYNSTNGNYYWYNKTNWLTGPVYSWYGIDVNGGVVTSIGLQENNLSGTIPSELGNLSSLQELWLYGNRLSGEIPSELGNLTSVYYFCLWSNQLTGPVPSELGNLTNAVYFDIDVNHLSGELPSSLGNLTNVQTMYLSNNLLTGELPAEFNNLTSLYDLYIYNNLLTGLPALTSVVPTYFYLGINNFTFGDFDNTGLSFTNYSYSPQSKIDEPSLTDNGDGTSSLIVTTDGTGNTYQWYNDGVELTGETSNELILSNSDDTGIFYCLVSNPNYPDLTLETLAVFFNETSYGGIAEEDYNVLVTLYNSTNGDYWNNNTNWLSEEDVEDWYGITTSAGHVTDINLFNNNLNGSIPSETGSLSNLISLQLSYNQLSGSIPSELGNLSDLQVLYLYNNQLTGEIPVEMGNLSSLAYLRLNYNQITGEIPAELGALSHLSSLYLHNNQLSGEVPEDLGNLANLYQLSLNNNSFTNLTDLSSTYVHYLYLQENEFTFGKFENTGLNFSSLYGVSYAPQAKLPEPTKTDNGDGTTTLTVTTDGTGNTYQWYNNTGILVGETANTLDVDNTLEAYYYCQVSNPTYPALVLETEYATFNMSLTHGIVEEEYNALVELYNATNGDEWNNNTNWLSDEYVEDWFGITVYDGHVIEIELDENNLSGIIPDELSLLDSIRSLDIHFNNISGEIPSELGYYKKIENLELWGNQLSGDIPVSLSNLTTLTNLDIGINQLTGSIPSELGNLVNLESLWLNDCNLVGEIPVELGNLTKLQILGLEVNQLSGSIPSELGNLTSLLSLYLYNNQFTGSIPNELGNLSDLLELYLYTNQLSGSIPTSFGSLSSLLRLDLSYNSLEGSIPSELGNLTNLQYLNLFDNQLTNSIPTELGNCTGLTSITLSNNQLSGSIPTELGNLTGLTYLSLKNNLLSGNIPTEIGNLTNLVTLSFRYNYLEGIIPSEIANLTNLQSLYLSNNKFSSCPDLSALTNLNILYIEENQLTFGDLENTNIDLNVYNYYYTPQAELPEPTQTPSGGDIILSFTTDGTGNTYQWFKDGEELSGETTNTLTIANTESGIFYCEVSNPNFYKLTLSTKAVFLNSSGSHGVTQAEYDALVAFYNSTNGDNWDKTTNWLSAEDVTDWFGITVVGGHVAEIVFEQNDITGTLPAEIGDLIYTKKLSISELGAGLTGAIPNEIGDMSSLTELKLYNNEIVSLPTEIGNLSSLVTLNLYSNNLTNIPSTIGNLENLYQLVLTDNEIASLPEGIGNLGNLGILSFSNNQLTTIPSTIGNLGNLFALDFFNNEINILPDLSGLSNLEYLDIYGNNLTFEDLEASGIDFNSLSGYDYDPQANLEMVNHTQSIDEDDNYTLSCDNITTELLSSSTNIYAVYKDGEVVRTWSSDPDYVISSFSTSHAGEYTIQVKNTNYPNLILYCDTLTIEIQQNDPPTNISLSNNTIQESITVGSTVGTLTTTDDAGDTHTYSLITGNGTNDANNASFTISGNILKTAVTFDFETQQEYNIYIQTEDAEGLTFQKAFVISVTNSNEAPTYIELSSNSIDENVGIGSVIGQFYTEDPDNGDSHTYFFATGNGTNDADNASFRLEGNTLKTGTEIDYETQHEYYIYIQTEDADGLTFQKSFIININDVTETGIQEVIEKSINVFPNPSSGTITLEFNEDNYNVSIYDIIGNKIYEETCYNKKVNINLQDTPKGVYFILVNYNDKVLNEKLILK